jgi:hypothetical protein
MTTRPAGGAETAPIPFHVRQGDVLLVRVDVSVAGTRHVPRDGDRLVLAYGEVTGHAHAVRRPPVRRWRGPSGWRPATEA